MEISMDIRSYRLYKVRKTLMELLYDRGFQISEFDLTFTAEDFINRFSSYPSLSDLTIFARRKDNEEDSIQCVFPYSDPEKKVGVEAIRKLIFTLTNENVKRSIIVVENGISPGAKQAIEKGKELNLIFEVFLLDELVVNITRHRRAYKHSVLTSQEKLDLLKRHKLKESQLPRILTSDPMAKYLGVTKGQVVKIHRKSETAGSYVTYRLAVNTRTLDFKKEDAQCVELIPIKRIISALYEIKFP
ncbi:DNA-directed RNA polymerases I, II, and III subunit rpabc1-like [Zophobas morio]|uniref:DNA-directed RNA polymerases I, II, and III subunit rpabc1-like n=1 Tax=Zophobas morio TaxID=2755281 RepID=UPI003083EA31